MSQSQQPSTSELNNSTSSFETGRRTSTSRFEIEKVQVEKENLIKTPLIPETESTKPKDEVVKPNESYDSSKKNGVEKSALKKTVKHYTYDDDYFVFDSNQNTATKQDSNKYSSLRNQHLRIGDAISHEQEPLTSKNSINKSDEDDDEDENANKDGLGASCFQINYNERNEPMSIICNIHSNSTDSYRNCIQDFKTWVLYQKLIAEFLGTMLLTLYACSIGLSISGSKVPSINGCLGGGLTLASLIWCLGNVSGGHFNPAVTISFLCTGKINPLLTVLYIGSQLAGAISGSYILKSLAPDILSLNSNMTRAQIEKIGVTEIHSDLTLCQAYSVELLITFILVLTIFSCVDTRRNDIHGSFPLQIGLAVAIGGLFGGRFTGGSMNPARSFGPAVASGIWKNHWIYWLGPISGAVLAGIIYQFILTLKCPRKTVARTNSSSKI